MLDDPALLGTAGGRALVLTGVFLITGAAACSWIAPSRALVRPLRTGALVLLAGVLAQTFGQLTAFDAWATDAAPISESLNIIASTNWGHTRAAFSAIAIATFLLAFLSSRALDLAARACAMFLLLILPMLGHTAASGNFAFVYTVAVVHATCAAIWLGTLALLAPSWWMAVPETLSALPRYGRLALVVAPLAVFSGVLTAWLRIEAPAQLLTTFYGRIVLAKSVVVFIILMLGARHHLRLSRASAALGSNEDVRTLSLRDTLRTSIANASAARFTLVLELVLAATVLALTGWLGESEPPRLE